MLTSGRGNMILRWNWNQLKCISLQHTVFSRWPAWGCLVLHCHAPFFCAWQRSPDGSLCACAPGNVCTCQAWRREWRCCKPVGNAGIGHVAVGLACTMKWSREQVLALIRLYEQHTSLYDVKHRDYYNRVKREHVLAKVYREVRKFIPVVTITEIKAKIKTLRSQYAAEKVNIEKSKLRGFEDDPKLWCFEEMKFLDYYIRERSGTAYIPVPQQSSNPPPPPPQQQQQPKMVPAPVLKKILPAAPQLPVKVAPKPPPPRPVSPPMPPAPPPEVCLRWNSYHTNMQATFPSLLNNEQFVDVTLACEGRSIKCHKMILSACSSYFEDLLSQNPCQHPIVLMKDLRFWEVQALVDFMYRGEVNVGQDKLPSLLAAAEALQIKGLAGPASTSSSHDEDSLPPPLPLATDDFLDEPVPSPSSARRARKRRTTHQSPVLPLLRPQLSKPHLRPVSLPSTSSGYQEDLGSTSAEPPARRQRKFGPQIVDHKIKTEPVDIDLSNDSVDANDDGYMNKAYETGGGDSSGLGDDSADEHPSNTDNKDILQEQQLDTEQQHLDYGNNNGMPPPASNEGGLGYPHQAAPPYPELIMPAQDHDMAESIHGPV